MKPPPPMLPALGCVTASANAVATAASTAFPPFARTDAPASDAIAEVLITMPAFETTGASGCCAMTARRRQTARRRRRQHGDDALATSRRTAVNGSLAEATSPCGQRQTGDQHNPYIAMNGADCRSPRSPVMFCESLHPTQLRRFSLCPSVAADFSRHRPPSEAPSASVRFPSSAVAEPIERARKPLNILILGGTGFTGPEQVEYAIARGHKVTLINRNKTRPDFFKGRVEQLIGDMNGDMSALKGLKFDVVIDNPTTLPAWVRNVAQYMKGNTDHYIFISTISVYPDNSKPNADETAPLTPMPEGVDPYTTHSRRMPASTTARSSRSRRARSSDSIPGKPRSFGRG